MTSKVVIYTLENLMLGMGKHVQCIHIILDAGQPVLKISRIQVVSIFSVRHEFTNVVVDTTPKILFFACHTTLSRLGAYTDTNHMSVLLGTLSTMT